MDSQKLDCFTFGRQLIVKGDLDPVYILLWEADINGGLLKRWLLAYFCFYHLGTSSWIADSPNATHYWRRMRTAAASKDYPRGRERRHFRGENARKSVECLCEQGVAKLFDDLGRCQTCEDVITLVRRSWVGFGPWIGFKIADMLERLNVASLRFSEDEVFLFDSPREGAARLNVAMQAGISQEEEPSWAIRTVLDELGLHRAPPRYERKLGVQEAETVLCKWKSYLGGHYRVGEDIEACRKALHFLPTRTSGRLLRAGIEQEWWDA